MEELLQRLWDQFCGTIEKLEDAIKDYPVDEEPFASLDKLILDTEDSRKLREDIYKVGIKRTGVFEYEVQPTTTPDEADAVNCATGCTWCGGKGILPCEVCGWEPPRT